MLNLLDVFGNHANGSVQIALQEMMASVHPVQIQCKSGSVNWPYVHKTCSLTAILGKLVAENYPFLKTYSTWGGQKKVAIIQNMVNAV